MRAYTIELNPQDYKSLGMSGTIQRIECDCAISMVAITLFKETEIQG